MTSLTKKFSKRLIGTVAAASLGLATQVMADHTTKPENDKPRTWTAEEYFSSSDPLSTLDYQDKRIPLDPEFSMQFIDQLDPLEGFNRYMYRFNYTLDEYVLLPIAGGYKAVTPDYIEERISTFYNNLGEIGNLFNSMLQLSGDKTLRSSGRIVMNFTLGFLGFYDPATHIGLHEANEDFGQTLGYWGVPNGPYLVLPFLGPSTVRDGTGLLVDTGVANGVDFLNYYDKESEEPWLLGINLVNKRATTPLTYDMIDSPFRYEITRYVYLKARELQIEE